MLNHRFIVTGETSELVNDQRVFKNESVCSCCQARRVQTITVSRMAIADEIIVSDQQGRWLERRAECKYPDTDESFPFDLFVDMALSPGAAIIPFDVFPAESPEQPAPRKATVQ